MQDALDILNPRNRYTAEGVIYSDRPEVEGGGVRFWYRYVNPYSATYRRLYANIQGESGEAVIRTNDRIKPVINKSVVRLSDGRTYNVVQVDQDFQDAPEQALRVIGVPVGTSLVLRLLPVDEPWA